MEIMDPAKQWLKLVEKYVPFGVLVLLVSGVALPSFVASRWECCGAPVVLKMTVVDAKTGAPVEGAQAQVCWRTNEDWPVSPARAGFLSATTDAQGTCEVESTLPGSGKGQEGRLRVHSFLLVRAVGYQPVQQPCSALLGDTIVITNGPSTTNCFPVILPLTRLSGGS
jgi:hypothetical protein